MRRVTNRKMAQKYKSKTWKVVIHDYNDRDITMLNNWSDEVNRMVIAKEICPETKRLHLQGHITFKSTKSFEYLKKQHGTAHWEVAYVKDAIYEMKVDSDVFINVNNRKQGARSDLDEIKEAIDNGASRRDIWMSHMPTMVNAHQGVYRYMEMARRKETVAEYKLEDFQSFSVLPPDFHSVIMWGEAGVGKTQFALAHFTDKPALFVTHMDDLGKFDPEHHGGIVFDDMSFDHLPRGAQINILDWDQDRSIHIRYCTAHIPKHTRKIFTTNIQNGAIFLQNDPALQRRYVTKHIYKAQPVPVFNFPQDFQHAQSGEW